MVEVFAVLFLASIGAFAYLAYKLHQRGRQVWKRGVYIAWTLLGVLNFISGFSSGNMVIMVIGASLAFANVSAFLTSYVESELRVKKILEVVSGIIALGIIVYGYIITRSLILGVITLFILAMLFMAFAASYLQPVIR
ncbi:hypothetical protein J7L27_07415 [Candidatus Bathyarchaeota archaeon]|nr:hypothetical protein [Candidatus Bathyarchaeota archaeon]